MTSEMKQQMQAAETWLARSDLAAIADMIPMNSKILDLGCGNGELLKALKWSRQAKVMGVEVDQDKIIECVMNGVPVVQADLNVELGEFPDNSYDYVILSRTLQAVKHPDRLLNEMMRIGKNGIISFMNFGQLEARLQILFGHLPVTKSLPLKWYETTNIHPGTLGDFRDLCKDLQIRIVKEVPLAQKGDFLRHFAKVFPNLFASNCIFVIGK
ncbi:MAG: methionine biosynthesis protein MetW [Lentisphaeria bacterium]|nr:methionine biosynthesis protein MetW [Lentisphaeria bacterium]